MTLYRITGVVTGSVVVAVLLGIWLSPPNAPSDPLKEARTALRLGQFDEAHRLAQAVPSGTRKASALMLAAEARQKQQRLDDAFALYMQVSEEAEAFLVARQTAGDLRLHQGRLTEAEEVWVTALRHSPQDDFTLSRLALLFEIEGRGWEALPLLEVLLKQGTCTAQNLLQAGDIDHPVDISNRIAQYRKAAPHDVAPLVGLAKNWIEQGKQTEAGELLERVVTTRPEISEAWVQLGLLASERPDPAFPNWLRRIADRPALRGHPTFWLALGQFELSAGRSETAARCLYEAARLHPNSRSANYQLGVILKSMGRSADAEVFLRRAAALEQVGRVLNEIHDKPNSALMLEAAQQLEDLGRLWESRLWTRLVWQSDPARHQDLRDTLVRRERAVLQTDLPLVVASASPALRNDLSTLPLPRLMPLSPREPNEAQPVSATDTFRFEDESIAAGVEFAYFNSGDPATEGMRMFEFTGGGVGAADFDRDGWPDLYATQGAVFPKPSGAAPEEHLDQIFRNLGSGTFANVTGPCLIREPNFSQGLAWGDLDHDGFPDLYVANFGPNSLFHNNGDGTFTDITEAMSDRGGDAWSTSLAMADVDGDSHPDLYTVNYLRGDAVQTQLCPKEGRPRTCPPLAFEAAEDSFHRSSGTGVFEERTEAAGFLAPHGNGLGVLVADFDGNRTLDLFVANDAVPNFFFTRDARSSPATFTDVALSNGTAMDGDGRSQACMGVAADDFNGDGLVDLYVTNFFQESKTYYENLGEGLFRDATRQAGLREPGYDLLGFGTQSLDANLDGLPDLVVVNGHVDDFRYLGTPFQMPPQFLTNQGNGRFMESPRAELGSYFRKERLGRGLALVDWNRDGREDFIVSHLEEPVSLVTNRSEQVGRWLAVHLVGTTSPRLPIGAHVAVTNGGRTRVRQLVAGHGYQACNAPALLFGLARGNGALTVSVDWPSGNSSRWTIDALDQEVICVEGNQEVRPLATVHSKP